jgi:hypothetical protein
LIQRFSPEEECHSYCIRILEEAAVIVIADILALRRHELLIARLEARVKLKLVATAMMMTISIVVATTTCLCP